MKYTDTEIAFKIIENIYWDIFDGENPSNAKDFIDEIIEKLQKELI